MKLSKYAASAIIASAFLIGCGSSSSSGDSEETSSISGKAVDGYLMNSAICLDLDLNGYCNSGEPRGFTEDDGSFKLDVTAEQKANKNYDKAPLIVFGGRDSDKPTEDFIGKLKAPNDGSGEINITPITTLVTAYLEQDANATIASAKQTVATKLNLTTEQIDEDPRESKSAELLKATQMIQKAVNTMVETAKKDGTTETQAGTIADDIMTSFAAGLDDVTDGQDIDVAVKDIVEKADTSKLKVVHKDTADKSKNLAKKNVELVAKVLDTTSGDLSDEELKQAMLKVSIVTSQVQRAIVDLNVSAGSFDVNITVPDLNSTDKIEESEKEMMLFDAGVDVDADDFNISRYADLNISVDQNITQIKDVLTTYGDENNDTIINNAATKIADKITAESTQEENLDKQIALEADYTKAENLDEKVNLLLDSNISASSDDAKNFVRQLRETADTFIDDENEFDTSTIVGSQNKMITDKIQPAVEDIASDFEASSTALETSVNAFNTSLESNFNTVLGTINTRIESISKAIDSATKNKNETESWEATTDDGDKISFESTTNGDIQTDTIIFNGAKSTIAFDTNIKDGFDLVSTASTSIKLEGTGYNLEISSLSFKNNIATFKASGTITGINNSSMTLTNLELSTTIDSTKEEDDMFTSISSKFDGTIISAGKSVQGILNISDAQSSIQGIYKDEANSISFDGKITAQLNLNDAKDMEGKTDWVDPQSLVMITNTNGEKSFVTAITESWNYENNINSYTFFTQSDANVTCTQEGDYNDTTHTYTNTFSCEDGITVTPYYGEDKTIIATVNGEDKTIKSAYRDFNGEKEEIHLGFENGEETYFDNGKLKLNSEDITISDIKVIDPKTLKDVAAALIVNGELTYSTKTIKLNATIKKDASTDTVAFNANDVEISNTNGSTKMTSLDFTSTLNDEDNYNNYQNHSIFETYTVNYDQYNDNNDNDEPQLNNIDLKGLSVNIKDTSSDTLSINADITYNKDTSNNEAIVFNGAYTYTDTTFNGLVDVKGNKEAGNSEFTVSGNINPADGFEPFNITVVGTTDKNGGIDAKSLFTRGANEDYKLTITVDGNETDGTFKLADSNGVHATYTETDSNESSDTITLTDKDGKSIATIDGNNITYSDDTTDTLSW